MRVAHFGLRHGKEPTSSTVIVEEYCREPGKERATQKSTTVGEIVSKSRQKFGELELIAGMNYIPGTCLRAKRVGWT